MSAPGFPPPVVLVAALAVLGLVSAPGAVHAQARVRAMVDTTTVTVGDRVTLTVTVDHPTGSRVVWPDSVRLAPFEVLGARASPVRTVEEGLRSVATLELAAFELGALEIPSLELEVVGADGSVDTVATARFGIEVASVGADEGGDIRDIRGPLTLPPSLVRLSVWALAAVAVVALAYLAWRRRKRRPEEAGDGRPTLPVRPPHEIALEALARLEASPLLERGQVKEYHIELSDIVRAYVELCFGVRAREMTTEEILAGLRGTDVDESVSVGLRALLEACDLVKFAKHRPAPEASREVLVAARELVRRTMPRPEAPATEAPAEAAPVGAA